MEKSIMPECYADTLLTETLVPPRFGYNHKSSCFKVEGEMKLGKLKDSFAVGIIDNDKNQIKYLNEFTEIDKVEGFLILWKHRTRPHFIIQLCPALEKWVLNVCELAGIDTLEHGVDSNLERLMKLTKAESSLNNTGLKSLFRAMCKRTDIPAIRKLKEWILLLRNKNYQVEINELKNA